MKSALIPKYAWWAIGIVVILSILTSQLDRTMLWVSQRRLVAWSLRPGLLIIERWRPMSETMTNAVTFWWRGWQRLALMENEVRRLHQKDDTEAVLIKENDLLRSALSWRQNHGGQLFAWKGAGNVWWMEAGCRQGVKLGEAVVHDQVIVGTVVRVSQTESAVATMDDPEWRLAVLVGTTSAQGIFTTRRGTPSVEELSPTVAIAEGDVVITAGQEGVPRALIIGQISHVLTESNKATKTATIDMSLLPKDISWVQLAESTGKGSTCQ